MLEVPLFYRRDGIGGERCGLVQFMPSYATIVLALFLAVDSRWW